MRQVILEKVFLFSFLICSSVFFLWRGLCIVPFPNNWRIVDVMWNERKKDDIFEKLKKNRKNKNKVGGKMAKREELEVNGHIIVLVEQPTQYILDLEKRFSDKELVGYCKEILKYPAGENPTIDEILNLPNEIQYKDLSLSLKTKDGKKDLYLAEELFVSLGKNKANPAYVAEVFLSKVKKNVNDYKYKELVDMGTEVFKQIGEMIYLVKIRDTFRGM